MIEVFRTVKGLWRILSFYFSIPCLVTTAFVSPLVISYHDFLVLFAPIS
jgi:hypothetical protein